MASPVTRTKIRQISFPETYPVRRAVLYPDGPESKIYVPNDESGIHFGAWVQHFAPMDMTSGIDEDLKADPVAVISLFREPLPIHLTLAMSSSHPSQALRFRKFACLERHQGRGVGTQVFHHVLDFVRADPELGSGSVVWCDARWSTREWYTRRGMKALGGKFLKGDIEYIVMAIQV